MLLEVCVEDIAGLKAAVAGGGDRIELCSALPLGGLTPSAGLMAVAAKMPVPAYAIIRPRAGNFVYSADELDIMKRDIDAARSAGLPGVVLGASQPDGRLDVDTLTILAAHAQGLGKTLHRAFDLVPDVKEAVEVAVSLVFERILTSGGARTAAEGVAMLEQAIAVAAGRISIMPGSGVTLATVGQLWPRLQIGEIHASCSAAVPETDERVIALGFSAPSIRRTDAATVKALKAYFA
ncbi:MULTISPECIES: copper homeostasis protein CutC [unclassified Rhizobium]|jgi:copper homeostasis protein|uniref:copper homeostasis protein CutC n=1 Tax=unclassified Rhizobium TaxID=2613769 RepID=UPI000646A697|nr:MULTISPECIES: copper homeostasis protein CutC [unclassified Rhizobium]MBN8949661.1 copper homeostasis protein CutC [Rhizobium tropici]OJY75435.1 MAG: copper homeostasis protein CutC [Rhizobium sp. 60-20]RKD70550.1 copper homeostasis protein [Rhizobium sp. WW_1]